MFFGGGTFLSLSSHPHWFVRGWDFPRPQLIVILTAIAAFYMGGFSTGSWFDLAFLVFLLGAVVFNAVRVAPYTPLAPRMVPDAEAGKTENHLRLLISNVQLENERHDLLQRVVSDADPDVVLLLEPDDRWRREMDRVLDSERYPYRVQRPQDNYYGICLYSRLELVAPRVLTLVEPDVPSIHTGIRLRSGAVVRFHGVHPRPPEPVRDQDSVERDAELVLVAALVDEEQEPAIVAGDLNDVAWSATTGLFLRLARMADPRVGRGFYNSWNARSRWMRLALDHVFHSCQFELAHLEILGDVGSDHFPVLAELVHRPDAEARAESPQNGDLEQARENLRRAQIDTDDTLPRIPPRSLPPADPEAPPAR